MTQFIDPKDFEYVFNDKYPNILAIKLLDEKYSGIIVLYDDTKLHEEESDEDGCQLSFTYELAVNPNEVNVPEDYIGNILLSIIKEQISGEHDTNTVGT